MLTNVAIGIAKLLFFPIFLFILLPLKMICWIWEEWRSISCSPPDGLSLFTAIAQNGKMRK